MKFSIERREKYVPAHAVKVEDKETKAVVYVYSDNAGRPCAHAFKPRAVKPTWKFFFRSEEKRHEKATKFFADVRERKAQIKADAGHGGSHTLKVGDILNSSWGYGQTNITFYEVTNLVGKTMVTIREVRSVKTFIEHEHGTCVPAKGDFVKPSMRKRVNATDNSIKIESFEYARPWGGAPKSFSRTH